MKKNKTKKRHINFKRLAIVLLLGYVFLASVYSFFKTPISNIYIYDNHYLSDQEIIELAKVSDYPPVMTTFNKVIENRLNKSVYIKTARVEKKHLKELHIHVVENVPMFYNTLKKETVLQDKMTVKKSYPVANLINFVPDVKYEKLITEMAKIEGGVLNRISEIEYRPNSVDDERFLLAMVDGNYVYLTLSKFDVVNNYVDIIKSFSEKKGILYLDSGVYFDVIEK